MISFDEAVARATEHLRDPELPVVITLQGRFAEGWYFCFQSREYLETGDSSALLAGNAPFIVDKDSGEIYELGTAYPLEKYLHDYEEAKHS